jgi:hypothetical protein
MEELVDISLKEPGKSVKIGSELPIVIREELESFLRSNSNVFTWTHEDMFGIDPSVIAHQLNVDKSTKSIKQKRKSFTPKRNQAAANEVEKLLQVDFIREVHYPEWLANVVLVRKSSRKWRMCVDFTDLNKSCPKIASRYPGSTC